MMTDKIAIVIPALNEEDALLQLLAEFPRDFASWVIVVDNGSTDATAAVARSAGAIVACEPVRGYGRACLKGFKTACSLGLRSLFSWMGMAATTLLIYPGCWHRSVIFRRILSSARAPANTLNEARCLSRLE